MSILNKLKMRLGFKKPILKNTDVNKKFKEYGLLESRCQSYIKRLQQVIDRLENTLKALFHRVEHFQDSPNLVRLQQELLQSLKRAKTDHFPTILEEISKSDAHLNEIRLLVESDKSVIDGRELNKDELGSLYLSLRAIIYVTKDYLIVITHIITVKKYLFTKKISDFEFEYLNNPEKLKGKLRDTWQLIQPKFIEAEKYMQGDFVINCDFTKKESREIRNSAEFNRMKEILKELNKSFAEYFEKNMN